MQELFFMNDSFQERVVRSLEKDIDLTANKNAALSASREAL